MLVSGGAQKFKMVLGLRMLSGRTVPTRRRLIHREYQNIKNHTDQRSELCSLSYALPALAY